MLVFLVVFYTLHLLYDIKNYYNYRKYIGSKYYNNEDYKELRDTLITTSVTVVILTIALIVFIVVGDIPTA